MLFPSSVFLYLFLPVLLMVYFLSPWKLKNLVLLLGSLFFYSWGESFYVLLLLASIALNYLLGLGIGAMEGRQRKHVLWIAVAVNLILLSSYKYANFIVDNLNVLASVVGIGAIELEPVHLPIGVSFYTFQAMSYLIDVYRRTTPAQKNIFNLALYISLFPQLIAGPIVRYHDIDKELARRKTTIDDVYFGTQRFVLGLAKKMMIANPMGLVADQVFAMPADEVSMGLAWVGIFAYSMQILFDFSAYSDMAIGLGRMFGFHFLENFNYPYISKSIQEFWRRWHISLSNWFRDYLYIPLGGNRVNPLRTYINLLLVFLLCGLWHGAAWNFVVWGLFHGAFLIIERRGLSELLKKVPVVIAHFYCIIIFMVGWVFFRSENLSDALSFLGAMAGLNGMESTHGNAGFYFNREFILVSIAAIIFSTPIGRSVSQWLNKSDRGFFAITKTSLNTSAIFLLTVICFLYIAANTYNPFIYFRF